MASRKSRKKATSKAKKKKALSDALLRAIKKELDAEPADEIETAVHATTLAKILNSGAPVGRRRKNAAMMCYRVILGATRLLKSLDDKLRRPFKTKRGETVAEMIGRQIFTDD